MQSIVDQLSDHVSADWGMTNDLVNHLASSLAPRLYRGLFLPEELPTKLSSKSAYLLKDRPFTIIVNVGGHFVGVYCADQYTIYFDPFGLPCMQTQLKQFLRKLKQPVFFSKKKIQTISSKHCGLYAVLFVLYHDKPKRTFKMQFGRRAGLKNDKLCVQDLHKLCRGLNK